MDIPGYQLLEKIGAGGAGTVYRACQQSLQRTVAIKLLEPREGQDAVLAFRRESQLLASLTHPNVVTIYDCGQIKGQYYLVTEYIPGDSLRSMMTPGRPWSVERVLPLVEKIARALGHIHKHGVLHLDLKPENVLVTTEGEIKIADFGLALAHGEFADQPGGTIDYCAPEQRFGRPVDQRADVFALAALTYELLTGHVPGRVYLSARDCNRSLPSAVDGVLRRGLERQPGDRYDNIASFWSDLSGAMRRRRVLPLVWAGVAAVAAAMLMLALLNRGGIIVPSTPSPMVVVFDRAEGLTLFAGIAGNKLRDADGLPVAQRRWDEPEVKRLAADWLPRRPEPLPVMLLPGSNTMGFFHPLLDHDLGQRVAGNWSRLQKVAEPKEDFIRAGDFREPAAMPVATAEAKYWRFVPGFAPEKTDEVALVPAPEREGENALQMTRPETAAKARGIAFYQYLVRSPGRAGMVLVMRYRVRALGAWQVCVSPCMPLLVSPEEKGALASHLRLHSVPLPELEVPGSWYRLDDWITPGPQWRTCYVVWEWPPYATVAPFRHVEVRCRGQGTLWLTGLEMFPWDPEAAP